MDFKAQTLNMVTSVLGLLLTAKLAAATSVNPTKQESREFDYQYNAQGLLTGVDGPKAGAQDITRYQYDNQGRLSASINALDHKTEVLTYHFSGQPEQVKDQNGVLTTFTYNGFGWLTSMSRNNRTISFEHDKLGQVIKVTYPDNSYQHRQYDEARRLVAIEDSQGNRTEYTLDKADNRLKTEIKNAQGIVTYTTSQTYDELSRLRSETDGEGNKTQYRYDKNNDLTQVIDALSHITSYEYDELARLNKTTDAQGSNSQIYHDAAGRVSRVVDAEGIATEYNYSAFNDRVKVISQDTGTAQYKYDETGNVTSMIDARGVMVRYKYDVLSRLTKIKFINSAENVSFSYDDTANDNKGVGQLTQVNDHSGSSQYHYDANGQVTKVSYAIASRFADKAFNQSYQTSYQYNLNGAISQLTYPSGRNVNFSYNSQGQLTGITSNTEQGEVSVLSSASYLPFGPVKDFTYGNDLVAKRSYDKAYKLTKDSLGSLKNQALSYTKTANIKSIKQDSAEQNFEYDALSQLTKATGSYGELNYSYDKIGNRKSKAIKGQVQSYDYKTQNHHLTKVTREGSAVPTQLAKYNQAGRLSALTQNNQVTHYQYNYLALRASKANSTEHVHYHYNLDGLLIAESTAAGQWQKEYIYFGNELVALIDYQSNSQGELYFVHSDYLATPKLITDSQKQVVWQAEYTPFGLGEINQDADGDGQQLVLNIRFPGQYFDKESKLHYNWHRYYDPEIGRYIRSDPIGLDDGPSTYGYVGGNPVNAIDPLGLDACYVNFPSYPITYSPGRTTTLLGGHSGVVGWDSSGSTRYYDYGRYASGGKYGSIVGAKLPGNDGNYRRITMPDLDIDKNGKPTKESWEKFIDELKKRAGKNTTPELECDENANEEKMYKEMLRDAMNKGRDKYNWNPFNPKHCRTVANDAYDTARPSNSWW